MLEGCCPRAAKALEEAEPDALACLDFPSSHWKRLRTNKVRERDNREIKRRSRVVQVFSSESSPLRHVGSVMRDQAKTWSGSRHFSKRRIGRAVMTDPSWKRPPGRWLNPALSLPTEWSRPRISIDSRSWTQGPKKLFTNFRDTIRVCFF